MPERPSRATGFFRGWWLFAPIWWRPGCPADDVVPRGWWAVPLYAAVEVLLSCVFNPLYALLNPDREPCYCFRITDPDWPGEEDA